MTQTHGDVHDIAIVGAGPIGIELHAALKRAGLGVLHLEAGTIGQTLTWWAPGTRFFSSPERIGIAGVPLFVAGQEKATREEYLTYLRTVVREFELPIRTRERVVGVTPGADGFTLRTETGAGACEHAARSVVLAIGDMHKPRLLGIPGEDLPHVSHYFRDPHEYFGRRVLIVGGKNSAVEAAIRLYRVGCDVTLSYRGPALDAKRVKYWLLPEINWLVSKGRIRFLSETAPVAITPRAVALMDGSGCPVDPVDAQDVLLLTGYVQEPTLFERAGVRLHGDGRKPEFERTTMETNVPGLYVAGTGAAGTQIGGVKVFIETAHVHVARIVAHLTGAPTPEDTGADTADLPES